jgi:hypothetical protein
VLSGGSKRTPAEYEGRTITAASLDDNALSLTFADGVTIHIWDDGQSCCEHRYMTSDDDPATLVGHRLVGITGKEGPTEGEDGDETHEVVFVEVQTDGGFITLANHNEHNGYYGGFGLTITEGDERGRWGSRDER